MDWYQFFLWESVIATAVLLIQLVNWRIHYLETVNKLSLVYKHGLWWFKDQWYWLEKMLEFWIKQGHHQSSPSSCCCTGSVRAAHDSPEIIIDLLSVGVRGRGWFLEWHFSWAFSFISYSLKEGLGFLHWGMIRILDKLLLANTRKEIKFVLFPLLRSQNW